MAKNATENMNYYSGFWPSCKKLITCLSPFHQKVASSNYALTILGRESVSNLQTSVLKAGNGRTQLLFAADIERGIQIFWTANRGAVSQWTIVKEEKDCGYQANNFSLENGCSIHGSKDLNATFNVGGKSNWLHPLI